MKKKLFNIIVALILSFCASIVNAQDVPYAELSANGTTFTFKYGAKPDGAFDLNEGNNTPNWADDENNLEKITKVIFDQSFKDARPTSCYQWFKNMTNLNEIVGMKDNLNTSEVTNMMNMFGDCQSLTILDLSGFNTKKVEDMQYMFRKCINLTTITVGDNWNTDKVSSSNGMFMNCTSLGGGSGTTFDANKTDKTYAHIDGGASNPGYLTAEPKPYAILSDGGKTLTFKYGAKPEGAYDLNVGETTPAWSYDAENIIKVIFDESFKDARPTSCYSWFNRMTNLTEIVGMKENLNTEKVTNMYKMFYGCEKLTTLDLSNFKTDNVTDMESMFENCSGLTNLNLNRFNTGNVTDMERMFNFCSNLKVLDISSFNTENVTNMEYMFSASAETILIGENWNTEQVTKSDHMFTICLSLIGNYGLWGAQLETRYDKTYAHANKGGLLTTGKYKIFYLLDNDLQKYYTDENSELKFETFTNSVNEFGGSEVTLVNPEKDNAYFDYWVDLLEYNRSLLGGTAPNHLPTITLSANDVGNRIYIAFWIYPYAVLSEDKKTLTFYFDKEKDSKEGTKYDLNDGETTPAWSSEAENITKVIFDESFKDARPTSCWSWFGNMKNLTEIVGMKEYLNTSEVTNMVEMFSGCKKLTSIDLSGFNTAQVTDMNAMFQGCNNLTTIKVSNEWTTSNVSDGANMFVGCSALVGGNGTTYDANHVDKTYAIIDGKNGNPGYLTIEGTPFVVLSDDGTILTFKYGEKPDGAYSLSSVGWKQNTNITKVVFDETFQYARPTQCSEWFNGLSNLSEIVGMKEYLNTEKVTTMNWMFRDCKKITALDLSGFKTDIVTKMGAMFYNCENLTVLDLRGFNTEKVTDVGHMFAGCKKLTTVLIGDNWKTDAVTTQGYMFSRCSSLIGNDGTKVGEDVGKKCAHADAGGYLTKDDYKIFYKWADDKTGAYQTQYTPSTFSGESVVNINNPSDREYPFLYWTQVSANGTQIGESSTNLTISAGDLGNKIYVMHWRVPQPYAELSSDNKTLTFKYGDKPDGAYELYDGETTNPDWYDNRKNITKVVFDASFAEARPTSCYCWFKEFENLKEFVGIENFNTSEVTTMRSMFDKCRNLESIDLSHFDTRNLKSMRSMFYDCIKLITLDLSSFNTDLVETMQFTFTNCSTLTCINIRNFNPKNVENMSGMFSECKQLTTILVGQDWTQENILSVTSSQNMFVNCNEIIGNDGTTYDASQVDKTNAHADAGGYLTKDNYKIFYKWADEDGYKTQYTPSTYNSSITPLTIDPPNDREGYQFLYWTRVSASGEQIGGSSASLEIAAGDIGNRIYKMHWAVPYVVEEDGGKTLTFKYGIKPDGAYSLNTIEMPDWYTDETRTNITKVVFDKSFKDARPTTCRSWFNNMTNLTEIVGMKEYLNTSEVTNMEDMFAWCSKLTTIDVSGFNTEKVNNMNWMFRDCENLTSLDLSGFKTDIVTDMSAMFFNCQKLTTLDLSAFNTKNVESMGFMFAGCSNLTTILISEKWKADEVKTDEYMFNNCPELIGNDGSTVGETVDKTYAHANESGYLTSGDYKIFYQWADKPNEYQAYEPSTFNGSVDVTIPNPERDGYKFLYWTRVSPTGAYDGGSSSTLTIAAGDEGNRIYQMHWSIVNHTVSFYNGTTFISSVEVPHGEILSDDQYPEPEKEGHYLLKWTVTDDPDEYGYGNYAVNEDINLYAQWMKDKFRIILPDHFEYITANNDDDLFEYDSEVQFKISDGYASSNVYYTLGDDTKQFPLTPNSEGIYTYKVKADRAEFYSSTKEFYTMKLGKNASANLPFASNVTINFTSDNSEVSVSNNRIVTTNNVAKGDVCTLTSNNYQIEITIIDPFENFFDEDQWYKEDVVFTCPDNDNNWILTINDSQNNTITQEGENNVVCKILDSDNIIAKESYVVRIDKNPPEISVQVGDYDIDLSIDEPKNYYLRLGAAFSVSAEDETSGVENVQYSLNGVSFNDFDQNIILPYGKSSVYFRSKDVAGNTTQTYSAWFSVFNDSKFAENLGNEITSAPIYYSSEMIGDQTFSISLEGNTIGAITEKNGLNLNFLETDNVIKINKEYLKTLLPGNDTILVHINPLGDSNGWESDLKPADYESQTMKIILEVKYEVMPSKYSFVMEADTTIKSFCRGDVLLMNMDFDKRYSMVDYISIDKLNINKEVPYEGIKFTVPEGTLSGGDEKIPVKFFKDDYMFENTMIFPANYPSERNIRLYDDVLALDNFDGQFLDGEYKWYMDGVEILGENKQFIDLLPYLNDGKEHIYLASVLNIDSLRFRVCPSDDFIVEQIAKKKAASVRTYPNPAVSNQPIYIELENFSDDDFSNAEIVIYNQLGIVVNRISEVKKINSIVLKDGFYNGTVFWNGVKTLNFKIIAE